MSCQPYRPHLPKWLWLPGLHKRKSSGGCLPVEASRDGVGEAVFHLPLSFCSMTLAPTPELLRLPVHMQICARIGLRVFMCTHECVHVNLYMWVCARVHLLSREALVDARGSKKPSGFAPEFTAILLSCSTSWTSAPPPIFYTHLPSGMFQRCLCIHKALQRGLHTGASATLLS